MAPKMKSGPMTLLNGRLSIKYLWYTKAQYGLHNTFSCGDKASKKCKWNIYIFLTRYVFVNRGRRKANYRLLSSNQT